MADESPARRLGLPQVGEGLSVVVVASNAKNAGQRIERTELIISNSFDPQRSDRTTQQIHSSGI